MTVRLLLIRHAQPINHCNGEPERMSGWADFPLSVAGRAQAKMLAQALHAKDVLFDAIYSSPLLRAADTARALSGRCSRPIELLDALREIDCGCVDGMPIPDVQREYAAYWQANLMQDDEDFRWPGGESYREMRERCIGAIRMLETRHAHRCIAVVTHAGVISQIVGYVHGLSSARWECYRPGNCSLNEIEWSGASGRVLRFDDRSHLPSTCRLMRHRLDSA